MNLYTILAHAKDELRRAKDHEQTIRAIVEGPAQIFGKSADDRKRELALLLARDEAHKSALRQLRDTEHAVDLAQAAIDQAEQDRREREWSIRQRLADALERLNLPRTPDDIDWHDLHFQSEQHKFDAIQAQHERDLRDPAALAKARAEMDELFDDKTDPEADYQADMQAERYSSSFDATRRRMVAQRNMDELYPTK